MKELPDDELDKLFRKSAEELDSNFDPQDWNALRKRLDENDGRTIGSLLKKWWPAGMLALLMIAGLTTYLLTDANKDGNRNSIDKVNQPSTNREDNTPGKVSDKNSSEIIAEQKKDLSVSENNVLNNAERKIETDKNKIVKEEGLKQPENNLSESLTKEKYSVSKNENQKALPRRGSETGGVYLEPNRSIGRKGDGAIISKNNTEDKFEKNTGLKEKADKPVAEIDDQEMLSFRKKNRNSYEKGNEAVVSKDVNGQSVINAEANEEQSRLSFSVAALKSRTLAWEQTNKMPGVEKTETPQASKPTEKGSENEKEPEPKFAVRFGYAPDLSAVGLKNFTKPGTAVSLLIEYSFLRRLYFQTGLIRSSKDYKAKAGEYEWPGSWNDQKARPTSIDAICKVIEIPLNLRFDIAQNERSRWFVGAGASSYYMQKEKYDYNYPPHSYDVIWKDYETSTGWYWLSHLNASAGYEYRFSKKLSLLAEPYVRIPVKKVGYGKVNLFSAGMWFSIRYTPVFKK